MESANPFVRALRHLQAANVDYVVVGGFAMVMHGCNRFTPDLNVMVSQEGDGLIRLGQLLIEKDFVATTDPDITKLASQEGRQRLIGDGKRWFFSFRDLEEPSFSVDVFLRYPVPFQQVFDRKKVVECSFGPISIASLVDLIAMKSMAGRGQDKADIGSLGLLKVIQEKIQAGASEASILALAENDTEQERVEGLYRFYNLPPDEKLSWLEEMIIHLGKFCVV